MKVLMIPTWYSNHDAEVITTGIFHYEQAIALQKYCDIALYYPFDEHIERKYYEKEEKGLYTYRTAWRIKQGKIRTLIDFLRYSRKVIKNYRPDILHAHVAGMSGRFVRILGKIYGIPYIVTEHNPIELMNLDNPRVFRHISDVYKDSKANICVSQDLKEKLEKKFPKYNFEVIYNGVKSPKALDDGVKYKLAGKINCCIVATMYDKEIKGYQYLLPAIKKLKEKYNIVLHICGGGQFYEYYKKMAKELDIEKNCIFYGNCDKKKVYSIMRQMSFAVSASLFESAGVAAEEALMLGIPMVVTQSGGVSSLVKKENAIVVEPKSVDALVWGIELMIENRVKYDSKKIQDHAYGKFEMDNICKLYMDTYRKVIKANENCSGR